MFYTAQLTSFRSINDKTNQLPPNLLYISQNKTQQFSLPPWPASLSIGLTFARFEVKLPALVVFEIKYRQKSKIVWQNIEYYYNYILILFISEKLADWKDCSMMELLKS